MKIRDISDRVYQGQVYSLLDKAQSSIVISMYLVRTGDSAKHPINRLIQDLVEARRRGVEVTIYLNTKFKNATPQKILQEPWVAVLQEEGAKVRLASPVRMLHDKLIVVDRRFVVEGSMNWSVSAIANNLESATLIDSPQLAEAKLKRIGFFPIWGEEEKKLPKGREALFPAGPPSSIDIPVALIEARKYFPKMIHYQRQRAMKIYLLFLYLAQAKGSTKFSFSPELVGEYLGILKGKDRTSIRRQVIRVLRDLEIIDKLLHVEFRHGKDSYVELFIPPGSTFTLSSEAFDTGELAVLDDNQIFLRLVRARLREEGKRLEDFTQRAIKKRFFIGQKTYRRTLAKVEK
ncbi:MAG: hypothetical protein HY447_05375 [Candidatus Omnitrophica bacterium]|nr:hypothetical protein [Candidatus Omnitrophota bacterium]